MIEKRSLKFSSHVDINLNIEQNLDLELDNRMKCDTNVNIRENINYIIFYIMQNNKKYLNE